MHGWDRHHVIFHILLKHLGKGWAKVSRLGCIVMEASITAGIPSFPKLTASLPCVRSIVPSNVMVFHQHSLSRSPWSILPSAGKPHAGYLQCTNSDHIRQPSRKKGGKKKKLIHIMMNTVHAVAVGSLRVMKRSPEVITVHVAKPCSATINQLANRRHHLNPSKLIALNADSTLITTRYIRSYNK